MVTCQLCRISQTEVIDTREKSSGLVRRRRHCLGCGAKYTTYEMRRSDLQHIKDEIKKSLTDYSASIESLLKSI